MNETDAVILQAARSLQRHPSNPWQEEIQALLVRAESGEDVTVQVIDLLSPNQNVRRWMREQIAINVPSFRGFEPLPGTHGIITASSSWICPREDCTTPSLPVIQEGEEPPMCELHHVLMVRRTG